jgi:hypothetical protein
MDHSTDEAKRLFQKMVQERVRLGMTRDQAEMLVAVLLWDNLYSGCGLAETEFFVFSSQERICSHSVGLGLIID